MRTSPPKGEVLIRVLAVGLCGSDAHWFQEGAIGDAAPGDGAGAGPRVLRRSSNPGHAPVSGWPSTRRSRASNASSARAGRPNLCLDLKFAGHGVDGALRRHMVWPERCLVPLPDHLTDEQGALLEPLGVALHAIDLAGDSRAPSVGVIGCGPIGLLLIAALRRSGARRIVATDPLAHRVEAARSHGRRRSPLRFEDGRGSFVGAVAGGLDVVFESAGTDAA